MAALGTRMELAGRGARCGASWMRRGHLRSTFVTRSFRLPAL